MHRFSILSFILIFIISSGCSETKNTITEPETSQKYNLDTQIKLAINQNLLIESEGLKVKFLKVTEDSRCPSDVTCIWAGQVGVLVNVSQNGKDLGDINLVLGPDKELAEKKINGYLIRLVKVDPYPISTKKIEPSDYKITVIISKYIDDQAC